MDINIKKLMYYFLKLYKSPNFDRYYRLGTSRKLVVLVRYQVIFISIENEPSDIAYFQRTYFTKNRNVILFYFIFEN